MSNKTKPKSLARIAAEKIACINRESVPGCAPDKYERIIAEVYESAEAEARRLREAVEHFLLMRWRGGSMDVEDAVQKLREALTPATPEAGKALQPTPEGGTK